jgi:hypothetical protein
MRAMRREPRLISLMSFRGLRGFALLFVFVETRGLGFSTCKRRKYTKVSHHRIDVDLVDKGRGCYTPCPTSQVT